VASARAVIANGAVFAQTQPIYDPALLFQALELTRVLSIDARCLRDKAEDNHDFGYELMKRFMTMLVQRLHAAQLQMLDVYGSPR